MQVSSSRQLILATVSLRVLTIYICLREAGHSETGQFQALPEVFGLFTSWAYGASFQGRMLHLLLEHPVTPLCKHFVSY